MTDEFNNAFTESACHYFVQMYPALCKTVRLANGMSQQYLAELMGVSQMSISKYKK